MYCCMHLIFWYALLETHISIFLPQPFLDIIYTWLACSTNTVWYICRECLYMLCRGLVCSRINVFEVNYLEGRLAGPFSLCVSKSHYWFLRYHINVLRNTAHAILVWTWYVPPSPLRFHTRTLPLPFPLSISLFLSGHTGKSSKIYHVPSSLLLVDIPYNISLCA